MTIRKQAVLCSSLMARLLEDIEKDEGKESVYSWGMKNKTQKINDAVRLRRELMRLVELLRK